MLFCFFLLNLTVTLFIGWFLDNAIDFKILFLIITLNVNSSSSKSMIARLVDRKDQLKISSDASHVSSMSKTRKSIMIVNLPTLKNIFSNTP